LLNKEDKGGEGVEFRAVIKKSDEWWIGWLIDLPGVNAQEKTREELLESLKIGAEDILMTPFEPEEEEAELVTIKLG
jgi:predicted RNase H-like HicB family nuclease